jgi:hypothetical protein
MNFWTIQTPAGYSTMFFHPTGYTDLPFMTLSGVVDTDKHGIPINFPFLLKEDFVGVIPRGTPIVQFLPFKRTDWKIEEGPETGPIPLYKYTNTLSHWYRDNFWTRKNYR